ncbi:rhodanese-related sulfurtransferase [Simkania negevensis]|uniref:tRNA uridine(34) hydroxylase n=1 Tax=Simkania negevensis TaxID=83561 RepID=A0ABS3ARM5_9BACT|nr:rhodanese-related sulfurtransferase [Simkania negevensis]
MDAEHPSYLVLAYYCLTPIADPVTEVEKHNKFFDGRDVAGRIYLSEEGINGQMSGSHADAWAYMDWLHSDERFASMPFKLHPSDQNVFAKMKIKTRKQLVALDAKVDPRKGGEHVSPKRWKKMVEELNSGCENRILLDVRNDYEWKVGHFQGSFLPECATFREFPRYVKELKKQYDPKKTEVMMCCTGGIRCELYSALLKDEGFEEVYQLDGGIINYGLHEGSACWEGKLFVFDDRMVIPISDDEHTVITSCSQCQAPSDDYYNCANMDCNALFVCCKSCLDDYHGCCEQACRQAARVRPLAEQDPHKPFRKWYHYFKE